MPIKELARCGGGSVEYRFAKHSCVAIPSQGIVSITLVSKDHIQVAITVRGRGSTQRQAED